MNSFRLTTRPARTASSTFPSNSTGMATVVRVVCVKRTPDQRIINDAISDARIAYRPVVRLNSREHSLQTRPSGACKHTPARSFPGGASLQAPGESRPSRKGLRRPTTLAGMLSLKRSPRVAPHSLSRNDAATGKSAGGKSCVRHAPLERGALMVWRLHRPCRLILGGARLLGQRWLTGRGTATALANKSSRYLRRGVWSLMLSWGTLPI
jgi:hypothetical protein